MQQSLLIRIILLEYKLQKKRKKLLSCFFCKARNFSSFPYLQFCSLESKTYEKNGSSASIFEPRKHRNKKPTQIKWVFAFKSIDSRN